MREIMFRGKRKDNDELVVSNSIQQNNSEVLLFVDGFWIEVIPETVGEYAGLKLGNGTQFFVGDVFRVWSDFSKVCGLFEVVFAENNKAFYGFRYVGDNEGRIFHSDELSSEIGIDYKLEFVGNLFGKSKNWEVKK